MGTRTTRLLTAALILGGALGCAPAGGSAVRVQISSDMRTMVPGIDAADGLTSGILLHLVEGLVAFGETGDVKPLMAEAVQVSPDGLSYTFQLRKGLRFHNGAEVTAADVEWSWGYFMRQGEWRCQREFDGRGIAKVVGVRVEDPLTITFILDKPNAMFLATMARPDCAMAPVVHKSSLSADGTWARPVGTGPFRFVEWKRGEYVRLHRFEEYVSREGGVDGYTGSKQVFIDDLYFVVVPDTSTAIAALKSGAIDVIPYLSPSEYSALKNDPAITMSVTPNMGMITLLFQTRDPLLKNDTLRQALAAAVDTERLAAAASDGLARRNNSVVPSSSAYHTAVHDEGYRYDPVLAKRLLAEAGYKGERLVIQTNQRFPWSYNVAIVAQSMLQAAGVNVTLEVLEWTTQLARYWNGSYQISAFPYSAQLDPAFGYQTILGSKDEQPQKVWEDRTALALNAQAFRTADRASRQPLFDQLHRLFLRQVPMLMIYNNIDVGASARRIEGYQTWQARPRLWEVRIKP